VARALYLDTSAVLRAVLESGLAPEIDAAIADAHVLLTSRLALVESSRVLLRVRLDGRLSERDLALAERSIDAIWSRADVWELSASICDAARHVAPGKALRALDALHLATYVAARRHIEGLELLTADERLRQAAEVA